MIGLGTMIDMGCILAGGVAGLLVGRALTPRIQDGILKATAVSILFVGISGAIEQMMAVSGPGLVAGATGRVLISLVIGSLIGELLDIEGWFERFGAWLKKRVSRGDDEQFVNAFVSSSLTVAVGAMAIVGAIQDGVSGDWSVLALKGAIDAVLVCVMTVSMGRGCIFSVIPCGILQGGVTVFAWAVGPFLTDAAIDSISLVGSIIIFCIGANLIWGKKFNPGNMLPAVVISAALALLPL